MLIFMIRKSGLIPFNPDAIDKRQLLPEDFQKKDKQINIPLGNENPGPSEEVPGPLTSEQQVAGPSNVVPEKVVLCPPEKENCE